MSARIVGRERELAAVDGLAAGAALVLAGGPRDRQDDAVGGRHLSRAYAKLGVRSRAQLAARLAGRANP